MLTFLVGMLLVARPLQEAPPADARPSIVLVTVDTLRREHLGCYGFPCPTSPRIDALAAQSVLFERAYATIATTFPSHLSILTGLYPHEHGHTSNRGAVRVPYEPQAGRLSIAGALASAGYRTAGFVSSVVLNERTGIGAGLAPYDGPKIREGTRSAHETMQHALDWLASVPVEEPLFLWVHLWDAHEPNRPDPEYAALLPVDDVLREWVGGRRLDVAALQAKFAGDSTVGERFFVQPKRERAPEERKHPPKYERQQRGKRPPPPPPFSLDESALLGLYARYDACVRQVDTEVGRLLDALAARGTLDRTAFVFTADHGQSLGEGELFGHGVNTQLNTVVPLLIRFPAAAGVAPQRTHALVSLVDLLPTLLARLPISGLEALRAQLVGADALAPGFARERVFTGEATEFHRGGDKPYACALVTGRWKYVHAAGETGRLYDLEGAGETVDVAAANEAVAKELDAQLAAELQRSILTPEGDEPVDPKRAALLEKLDGLGYGGDDDDGD